MFVTKRSLPRRTFLRGAGAALALPLLDAMVPALTAVVRTAAAPQRRLGFVYIPHGVIMDQWTPATAGAGFELTQILTPLEPFRDSLVVVSNLTRAEVNSNHAVSSACWLTGVPPKRTDGPDFRAGMSVDQVIAKQIGQDTIVPVARGGHRGLHGSARRLRSRLQLRVHEHAQLADADVAAADGDQPARGVRAHVRRRQHAGRAAARACGPTQHPRFRRQRSAGARSRARRARPRDGSTSTSSTFARSSGGSSAPSAGRHAARRAAASRSACPSRTRSTSR